jgi:prepilin signal peptidase PulO-like enzyme (type II secretory pathway)
MNTFFYIILFILWTMFWSFASVVIYRIKSWEKWILWGRSHCWSCNKVLKAVQLVPIFSWILSKWKCTSCKNKISKIYPILEISSWLLFLMVWYFLIDFSLILELNFIEIIKLFFFIIISFFSIIYIFYDILFLEISDRILALSIIITVIIIWIQTIFQWFNIIETLPYFNENIDLSVQIYAIILSVLILIGLYIIMFKELHEIIDILILIILIWSLYLFKIYYNINLSDITILNSIMWALSIFIFFFLQIIISKWKWMWWGDLRIAILVWLIMWVSLSFAWMMITYIVWSIIWVFMIILWKIISLKNKTNFSSEIPFWPFIAIGFYITIFLNEIIINLINLYL